MTGSAVRFEVTVAGMRRRVHTAQGLVVNVLPAAKLPVPDVAIVPALGAKMPAALQDALRRPDVVEGGSLLRTWARDGAMLGAACTATFLLADTGLLDGQEATTTWWLAPLFRERYPRVRLDESRMLIGSRRFVTAGAAH